MAVSTPAVAATAGCFVAGFSARMAAAETGKSLDTASSLMGALVMALAARGCGTLALELVLTWT